MILSHFDSNARIMCACDSRTHTEITKKNKRTKSILCPQTPAGNHICIQVFCGDAGIFSKNFEHHGNKTSRRALGCPPECADLENEAKTTLKVIYLSFNFCLPTSCRLSPYYSLSLSRISSTSHGKSFLGSWRVRISKNG